MLVFLLLFPEIVGLWFGLIFGAFEYARLRFFLDFSNELSVEGAFSLFVLAFIACGIGMALYMIYTLPRFLRHCGMKLREYCHLPKKEMNKLWDEYKR